MDPWRTDTPESKIDGVDAVTLLYHLLLHHNKHGTMDADRVLLEIIAPLKRMFIRIPTSTLESGLYCCNMLDEETAFTHLQGLTFDEFCAKVSVRKFDKTFNCLEE